MPPRPAITAFRLKLLPLALALIVVTTAMPVELRAPVGWDGTLQPLDLAINLVLYAPLGLVLRRWPWRRLLLAMLVLSTVVELTQIWNCDRHPSPGDVVANAAGALLARWLGRRRWPDATVPSAGIPVGPRLVLAAVCGVAALLALGNLPARPSAIAGWDPGYALVLGNTTKGDRPWRGTIESLALFPDVLSRAQRRAAAAGDSLVACVTAASLVMDGGQAVRLPADTARDLALSASDNNALAIVARLVPAVTTTSGPARIVTFSTDDAHSNFDLMQAGRQVVFRVRTPLSGDSGSRRAVESPPLLEAGRPVNVVAAFDGRVARLYIDGRLCGRENFAAAGCAGPVLADEELPAVCAVMGALLAVIAMSITTGRGRWAAPIAAVAAGAVTLALPVLAPGVAVAMAAMPWAAVGGLIGVGAVVVAGDRRG